MKAFLKQKLAGFRNDESGAVSVVVALLIVVLLGMGALAVDIGHLYWVQNQLKKAAEAGALAGARGLWPMNISSAVSREPNCTAGANWALTTTTTNTVEGINLTESEVKVEVGRWDYATKTFAPGAGTNANGVRVTTSRAKVPVFLGKIFGISSEDLTASATAIMDIIGSMPGQIPIALSKKNAQQRTDPDDPQYPQLVIQFGTSSESNVPIGFQNGGWFSVPPDSCSASVISSYITDSSCPYVSNGMTINLSNGEFTSSLKILGDLLNSPSNTSHTLDTYLPVVNSEGFTQSDTVVGFVHFLITAVDNHGKTKTVAGQVLEAGILQNGSPGGGGNFGVLSAPKLVQ